MYRCENCLRNVGLMADKTGQPAPYLCPYTGRVSAAQEPIRRKVSVRKRPIEDEFSR